MLSDRIADLITAFNALRSQPGLNKKAINKTIARLEEAQLWSEHIATKDVAAEHSNLDQKAPNCTCPMPGAANDPNCPVHGNAS